MSCKEVEGKKPLYNSFLNKPSTINNMYKAYRSSTNMSQYASTHNKHTYTRSPTELKDSRQDTMNFSNPIKTPLYTRNHYKVNILEI